MFRNRHIKKHYLTLGAATFAVVIGYFSFLSPIYLKLFLPNAVFSELSLIKINSDCNQIDCQSKYIFKNLVHPSVALENTTVVLGRIWNSFTIKCAQETIYEVEHIPGGVGYRQQKNNYNVLPIEIFKSCGEQFEVIVHYPPSQRKNGFLDGFYAVTSAEFSSKLARMNEVITRDFQVYVLLLSLAVYFFSLLIRLIAFDKMSKARLRLSLLLIVGTVTQTGLLETFFPISNIVLINLYFAVISICSYIGLSIPYFLEKGVSTKEGTVFKYSGVAIFILVFAITQNIISVWIYYFIFYGAVAIVASLLKKNLQSSLLSIAVFCAGLEFYGIKNLPNGYFIPVLLAFLLMIENYKALKSYLKINRLLKLSRSKGSDAQERKQHRFRTHAIIKLFQRQFQMGRITVLNLSDPEVIQLQQYTRSSYQPENLSTKELPPIFAHVVTTGNALINVHSNSALVISLRRNAEKRPANSDYFTVLPIFAGKETIGAIALTEYDTEQFKSSLNYSTFLFCLDILKGLLVEHLLTTPKTESLNKISSLHQHINDCNFDTCNTLEELIDKFGEVLNSTFGWRVISATLPTSDYLLKVGAVYSFDPEIKKQVIAGKLYAHEDNKQGPLALAVHEKKPVIVPNTKWLEGVVHPNTTKFFNIHSTKTAAFVPVLAHDETVVGVYWIEGVKDNEISYSDRELFNSFMSTVSEKMKLMKSNSKLQLSHNSLAQFLPKHLVEDYLAGKDVKEVDFGFLMMLDLKGSTRLSHALGNAVFHSEVERFKNQVEPELKSRNWILQQFVWDGFEFTHTSPEEKKEKIGVLQWKEVLEPILFTWKEELRHSHGEKPEIEALSYRLCFTYGDTSRGIVVEGATQKWSFTGNAIAVVSKVEQAAKHLPGKIFCDPSMLKHSDDEWAVLHTTNQGLIVYGLNETIADQNKSAA